MFTRPDDLSDAQVADALATGWGLRVDEIEYAAVGFGSHHWRRVTAGVERWFVTVDDLEARRRTRDESTDDVRRRLAAALTTAWSLRDAGMAFVVAPQMAASGAVLHPVGSRFAVALYPHVDGESHGWGPYPTRAERLAVLELLAELHVATEAARAAALTDDLTLFSRDQLAAGLADLDRPWKRGPFGEPARALLGRHAEAVGRVLERYDRLAARVGSRPERMVVTHGEPHRGNTITTARGVMLVDWDTALIAPPERDLWFLADDAPSILQAYAARTGITPDVDALELYRLSWDLTEVSIYIGEFHRDHADTEDTRVAWAGLTHHLDPSRWQTSG